MGGNWRLAVMAVGLAVTGTAQSLVEHAAAAAVGTAGSAGGKKISDGLDRVFKKTGGALEQAAGDGKPAAAAKSQAVSAQAAPAAAAAPAVQLTRRPAGVARKVDVAGPAADPAPEIAPVPEAAPVVAATPEAFARVVPGVTSQEMAASLGSPTARISIPEGGRLVEIYRYAAKGVELGSIRVVDGAVTEVRAAVR